MISGVDNEKLFATCDNKMKVYIDGVLHEDDNMLDWQKTSTIPLNSDTRVMAIECEDVGSQEGILASTNDGMVTDGSWKCSPEAVEGWTDPDFDDSSWGAPSVIGGNGIGPWGERPGIAGEAQWIWPEGDSSLAYCRKTRLTPKTLVGTCDDHMIVYVDGTAYQDDNMQHWNKASTVTLPIGSTVLAIECFNTGGPFGIIGSTNDGMLTDDSWKCSGEMQDGWMNPDFDDSSWETAQVIKGNDDGGDPGKIDEVSDDAQWIWSTGGETTSYCRKMLIEKDTSVGKLEVTVVDIENKEEQSLMAVEGDHGDKWIPLNLHMQPTNRLSAIRLKGYIGDDTAITYGDIAIDDVLVKEGGCFDPTTTPATTTTTTPQHIPDVECDFEEGLCQWDPMVGWVRSTGETADHTTGEASGAFAAVDFATLESGAQAKLQLKEAMLILSEEDTHCLQFYYKLDSALPTRLQLNLQTQTEHENGAEGTRHWMDEGARGQGWILGQYEVNKERTDIGLNYFLLFISTQDSKTRSSIDPNLGIVYLDDITYTKGRCPTVDVCTFENPDVCGWHAEGMDTGTWVRTSTKDELCQDCPPDDHTYHSNQGHYMAVRSEPGEETKSALLISPVVEAHEDDWCLRLFFESYDLDQKDILVNIYARSPGQSLADLQPILTLTNNVFPNQWMPLLAPVVASKEEQEVKSKCN